MACTACVALTAAYAHWMEPYWVQENQHSLGAGAPAVRLVHLSDIHVSASSCPVEKLEQLVTRVNALRPGMIVFTGDLFTNYARYGNANAVSAALAKLEAPYGKFAVWGNHDKGGGAVSVYRDVLERAGFTLLVNETALVYLGDGSRMVVGGVDDAVFGSADVEGVCREMASMEADYRLLLMHEPDLADLIVPGCVNAALAGHSHGGQVVLPIVGAPLRAPLGRKYVSGFYWVNGMLLFVNRGVGTSALPLRFFAPPEIAVFTPGKE